MDRSARNGGAGFDSRAGESGGRSASRGVGNGPKTAWIPDFVMAGASRVPGHVGWKAAHPTFGGHFHKRSDTCVGRIADQDIDLRALFFDLINDAVDVTGIGNRPPNMRRLATLRSNICSRFIALLSGVTCVANHVSTTRFE